MISFLYLLPNSLLRILFSSRYKESLSIVFLIDSIEGGEYYCLWFQSHWTAAESGVVVLEGASTVKGHVCLCCWGVVGGVIMGQLAILR